MNMHIDRRIYSEINAYKSVCPTYIYIYLSVVDVVVQTNRCVLISMYKHVRIMNSYGVGLYTILTNRLIVINLIVFLSLQI